MTDRAKWFLEAVLPFVQITVGLVVAMVAIPVAAILAGAYLRYLVNAFLHGWNY